MRHERDDGFADPVANVGHAGCPGELLAQHLDGLHVLGPGARSRQRHCGNRLAARLGLRLDVGWFLLDQLQHDVDHAGVELLAGFFSKFRHDLRKRQRIAVGPIGSHRVKGIACMNDPRFDGDLLTLQPIGIPGAIPPLVLSPDDGAERGQERDRGKDAFTNDGVFAHDGELFRRERTGFLEDVPGNADLSDVVEQRSILQQAQRIALQAEPPTNVDRELGGFP